MMTNVLVSCGGGLQGDTLIGELQTAGGFRIHVVDSNKESIGKYKAHDFQQAPRTEQSREYLDFLRDYVTRHEISAIIPATPHDLQLLASVRDEFAAGFSCKLAVCESSLLEVFLNKRKTISWLELNQFPVLPEIDPQRIVNSLPVFGRRQRGWGGRDTKVISQMSELSEIADLDEYIWTRYLDEFREFSVDFCISFTGRVSPLTVRERLATVGGFSVVNRSAGPRTYDLLASLVSDMAKRIEGEGGCGYFNVQVLINDEVPQGVISDVNPRIGTSAVMARHHNIVLCDYLFDRDVPANPWTERQFLLIRSFDEYVVPSIDARGVKAVVFDLDDTLISHRSWIVQKAHHVAKTFVHEFIDEWMAVVHQLIDEGRAGQLYDELTNRFSITGLRDEMIALHRAHQPKSVKMYADVSPVLEHLSRSFELVLLSDNPAASQRQKLERLPVLERFGSIVLTEELGFSKPDKRAFEAVCSATGLEPEQIVMVGDNFHRDVLGARQAGFLIQFHIQREDRMFNTLPFERNYESIVEIRDLSQVRWCLMS